MMDLFTSRPLARKICAVAILFFVFLLIYAVGIAPILDAAETRRETTVTLDAQLRRYSSASFDLPELEQRLAALNGDQRDDVKYLDAGNETLAAVAMQNRIKTVVVATGGKLLSVETLRPEVAGAVQKIIMRARVWTDLTGLQQILFALDEAAPPLFFDALDITRSDGSDARGSELHVDFTIYGLLRKPQ